MGVETIKKNMSGDERRIGAEIVRKALLYPLRLIANNAGANGSVVVQRVYDSADTNFGYNAATGNFEDLMNRGIIDPTKVIRCALENSSSVARTFLTTDCVVCENNEENTANIITH